MLYTRNCRVIFKDIKNDGLCFEDIKEKEWNLFMTKEESDDER